MRQLGMLQALNHQVKVTLVKESEASDIEGLEGLYDPQHSTIHLNRSLMHTLPQVQDTAVHETLHFLLAVSGVRNMLKTTTRLNDQAYEDFEESMVRMLTPALLGVLPSLDRVLKNLKRIYS